MMMNVEMNAEVEKTIVIDIGMIVIDVEKIAIDVEKIAIDVGMRKERKMKVL
jgi:hypothetical protein